MAADLQPPTDPIFEAGKMELDLNDCFGLKDISIAQDSGDSGISSAPSTPDEDIDPGKSFRESRPRRSKRKSGDSVASCSSSDSDIYHFRDSSLVNRVQSERKRKEPKQPKPKSKPPPLSKYRRKAANSRERGRMVEINDAFEDLKVVLPDIEACNHAKMTKITTLRLALNYISALRQTLGFEDDLNSDASSSRSSCISSGDDELCHSPPSTFDDIVTSEDIASGDLDIDLPSGLLLS